jgi:predicted TIM-barrel fold metal-dependent hydrolase
MWRMDAVWEARRADLPSVKRRPSEYIKDHLRLSTQPLEDPEDIGQYQQYLRWMESDELLMFSSDYPHWS